jgi:1-acyl-sn-glycerol-3-phosphate acyltransferase
MIRTRHSVWAHTIFRFYINRLIQKNFHNIYLQGNIPVLPKEQPILLLPNHSSWWDGFLVYWINEKVFHRTLYLMMLEEQLTKYPFFSRVGAYSISSGQLKDIKESLEYTMEVLESERIPSPMVCLFPQGELKTARIHPLGIKSGYHRIVSKCQREVLLLPLAIRLEFVDQQRAEIFFRFGEVYTSNANSAPSPEKLDNVLSSLLKEIDEQLIRNEKGKLLVQGRTSVNEKWDNLMSHFPGRKGN